jgi:hypothetical protein
MPEVDESCIVSRVPFFPWLNEYEDRYVELFPGIWIFLAPEIPDVTLQDRCSNPIQFHLIKACAELSMKTSHGLVSELIISYDATDDFLSKSGISTDYGSSFGSAVFTATSILFSGDYLMRKLLSTEKVSYLFSTESIESIELKSILFDMTDDLQSETMDFEKYQVNRNWIWNLALMLIYEKNGKLIRLLMYCQSAQYHNNEYHTLMNYYSGIESLFNFSPSETKKNIALIIPLISYFGNEEENITFDKYSLLVNQTMKNVGDLRNVYAHGNKMRNKHLNTIADTTVDLELILHRLLLGIIDIGFLPSKDQIMMLLKSETRAVDWVKNEKITTKSRSLWDSKKLYNFISDEETKKRFGKFWVDPFV